MAKSDMDFGQGGLLAFWNSLSNDEREALVKNLNEFHALISSLKGRGIIETDRQMTKIVIVTECDETNRLKELAGLTNAQGIKFEKKKDLKRT